jgi:hypothetical protein
MARPTKTITHLRRYAASLLLAMFLGTVYAAPQTASWHGTIRNARGDALPSAQVELRAVEGGRVVYATADSDGAFAFDAITAGSYHVSAHWQQEALSGAHDIDIGDLLPDTLSSFLTGAPHSYTTSFAPPMFAQGAHIGEVARISHHGSGRAGLQPRRYRAFLIIAVSRAPRSPRRPAASCAGHGTNRGGSRDSGGAEAPPFRQPTKSVETW